MSSRVDQLSADGLVKITYRILHNGQVLEASSPDQSVEYRMGAGNWPGVIEQSMLGASEGKRIHLHFDAAENAFGKPDPERIIEMDMQDFEREPEPGELIEFELQNRETVEGQVLMIFGDKIHVDFNHPYAGRDLDIEIVIKSIL